MNLHDIVYHKLQDEEDDVKTWSKSTIFWVTDEKNKRKTMAKIRSMSRNKGLYLQPIEVDEIFMQLLEYLYAYEDYSIDKAVRSDNEVVTLEGFINSCLKFCIKRYRSGYFMEKSAVIPDTVRGGDDEEFSLFDTVADDSNRKFDESIYVLEDICKQYECERYRYGVDMYMLFFIRLLTIQVNKENRYEEILINLEVPKDLLSVIESKAIMDGPIHSIVKASTLVDIEEAVNTLERFTYSARMLREVVDAI